MDRPPGPSAHRTCIVVPCYNEETRLDVTAFAHALRSSSEPSFIFVNDGSTDGTLRVLEGLARDFPTRVRALDLTPNGGKAEAVRRGMELALEGDSFTYAGYWDADLATPLDAIEVFVSVLERRPDVEIVFGTRVALLGRQIDRLASRHYSGRIFATAASMVLSIPVYDTQCGAKLFRVNDRCRSLFGTGFGSRWIFDVELAARYIRDVARERGELFAVTAASGNVGIYELPLDKWTDVGDSKVRTVDFVRAVGEMAAIYREYRLPNDGRSLMRALTAPFIRYAGAGVLGTTLHYAVLMACVELAGMSPVAGAVAGATAGALLNYVLNYNLTFASKKPHRATLPRFLAVAAVGIALNGLIVKVAVERAGFHYLTAQLVGTVTVLCTGYVLNKIWTFAE